MSAAGMLLLARRTLQVGKIYEYARTVTIVRDRRFAHPLRLCRYRLRSHPQGGSAMTQIGNIGPGNSQLYQFLTASTAGPTDSSNAAASDPLLAADATSSSVTTPLSDLRGQIETAVTDAVNNLGPSSTPSDLIQAIQNAVQQTLKANGIDPQQFAGIQGGHHRHHHAASSQAAPQSTSGGGDSDGDSDGSGTTTQQDPLLAALQSATSASQTAGGDLGSQSTQQNDPLLAALQASGSNNGNATSLFALLIGGSSGQSATSDPLSSSQAGGNGGLDLASLFTRLLGNANAQPGQANSLASSQSTANGSLDLTSLFAQLFAHFPNGSGVDTLA
jgi:hypothetical protein